MTGTGAAGAVGEQTQLLLLDAVLHLAAGAVDLLVQPLRRLDFGEFQVGHHEARIGALPQVLGLADHAPLAAPRAVRAIAELAEAAHRLLFFSLFQWILPNYSMNSSGRCSNWFTTAGEN